MRTEVDVDLYYADLDELLEALDYQFRHNREYWVKRCDRIDVYLIIRFLEALGCPKEIIEQLDGWNSEPVPTQQALEQWLESCQVKHSPKNGRSYEARRT